MALGLNLENEKAPCKYLQGAFLWSLLMHDKMGESNLIFEQALADLQNASMAKGQIKGSPIVKFTETLFHIAATSGAVSCTFEEENQIYVSIENEASRVYELLAPYVFRIILARIALFVWNHNSDGPARTDFNPYGDKTKIEFVSCDGITTRFFIETANTNGQPYYFIICRVE